MSKKKRVNYRKQIECNHECLNGLVVFPIVCGKLWKCNECGIIKIEGLPNHVFSDIETIGKNINKLPVTADVRKLIKYQVEKSKSVIK